MFKFKKLTAIALVAVAAMGLLLVVVMTNQK